MINIMKLLEILLLLMTMMMIFQATKVKGNFNKNFPKGRRKFVERGMKETPMCFGKSSNWAMPMIHSNVHDKQQAV